MTTIHDPTTDSNPTAPAGARCTGLSGTAPPTSRIARPALEPPSPSSMFAVRADGAILLSLEDAADRDLAGRTLVTCLVLDADESATARARVAGEASETAAHLIARLPKRKP